MSNLSRLRPNAFISKQKGYAVIDKQISDEAVKDAITKMVQTDTLPKRDGGLTGRVTRPKVTEDAKARVETWQTPNDAEGYYFRAKVVNKTTTEVDEYMAHTEDELLALVAQEHGKFIHEQAEIEASNHPEIPDDEEARECAWWQRHTYNGREYASIACDKTWAMMWNVIRQVFKGVTDRNTLEGAYIFIADEEKYELNFERFFAKRDRLAEEAAEQNAETTQRANEEAAIVTRQQAEEEKFSRKQKIDRDETEIACLRDMSKSPEGMAALKRMIQAEKKTGRTPTLPSSGTGQRIYNL